MTTTAQEAGGSAYARELHEAAADVDAFSAWRAAQIAAGACDCNECWWKHRARTAEQRLAAVERITAPQTDTVKLAREWLAGDVSLTGAQMTVIAQALIDTAAVHPLTPWMLLVSIMAERDRLAARLERIERRYAGRPLTFDETAAMRLADEVAVLVRRKVIDARSPAGDALLDFRDPPSTPRADRIARLEAENDELRKSAATWKRVAEGAIADRARLDVENTVLIDQWWRAAQSLENYEANHGARCDAEQEQYATIAESACRMLGSIVSHLHELPSADGRSARAIESMISEATTFLSAPGQEVHGLRAQLAARDRSIDACTARIADILAWQAETMQALENLGATLTATDEKHSRVQFALETTATVLGLLAADPAAAFIETRLSDVVDEMRKALGGQGLTESGTTE